MQNDGLRIISDDFFTIGNIAVLVDDSEQLEGSCLDHFRIGEAYALKRIFIGEYREFYPERTDLPTMKDHFEEHPYPGQGKIIYFLMHGIPGLIGMRSVYDTFTGERIRMSQELLSYGNYEWWGYLVHYVKKYNLRLPSEFEEYILKVSSKEVYENYKKNYW